LKKKTCHVWQAWICHELVLSWTSGSGFLTKEKKEKKRERGVQIGPPLFHYPELAFKMCWTCLRTWQWWQFAPLLPPPYTA
jgi:hypothetical protein